VWGGQGPYKDFRATEDDDDDGYGGGGDHDPIVFQSKDGQSSIFCDRFLETALIKRNIISNSKQWHIVIQLTPLYIVCIGYCYDDVSLFCGTPAVAWPIVKPPDDTWLSMEQWRDDTDRGNPNDS
jgi:hypothetical protein